LNSATPAVSVAGGAGTETADALAGPPVMRADG